MKLDYFGALVVSVKQQLQSGNKLKETSKGFNRAFDWGVQTCSPNDG